MVAPVTLPIRTAECRRPSDWRAAIEFLLFYGPKGRNDRMLAGARRADTKCRSQCDQMAINDKNRFALTVERRDSPIAPDGSSHVGLMQTWPWAAEARSIACTRRDTYPLVPARLLVRPKDLLCQPQRQQTRSGNQLGRPPRLWAAGRVLALLLISCRRLEYPMGLTLGGWRHLVADADRALFLCVADGMPDAALRACLASFRLRSWG